MLRKLTLAAIVAAGFSTPGLAETLKWGSSRDIYSLDPYSYGDSYTLSFLNHVYEGLVRYDANLEIEPALATSWETVSDTVWRFHLREGVKFHNGADFTADDVIASLTRVSDPVSPLRGNLPAYKGAKKVDDHTVDIELVGPYPLLLNDLTNIHVFDLTWLTDNKSLKPTDVGAKVEGYATYNANGTGAFKVESRVPDSKTVLVKNPGWWDASKSNIDRIEFTPITSAATRVAALLSGEINFTENAPSQDLPRLVAQPDLKVMERTDLRTIMVGFNRKPKLANGADNKFNDLRVRQAFAHALDSELVQKRIMRGKSRTAGAIIAPEIPGYVEALDSVLPFDPDLSKKLLAEAGASDLPFTLVCTNDAYVNEEELCQGLVNMLTRAGFKPQLDIAPAAAQTPKRAGGLADVYLIGWANEPMLDSYSILLQMIKTKTDKAGVFNWGGWTYPEIDKLIEQASTEMDRTKRLELQTKALQMAKDDLIMLPLHQQPMAWVMSNKIDGITQLADNKPRHWLTHFAQ
ncbi:ABC transporter substrate-binding protein [Aminobacter carboxidus]|uniref:ABC transporter substrate-binding protein n=1 Tax=Aminobacter carboxidus TaxID=376165 RepID=A0A8E1WDN8_9HYPH|nr:MULTISPECIES: ABC transporter substrate-binding protein [Aminobacter carboxidus group]MBB6466353.1 peptide/nickel transport system substrate-binding protein [Aminobacter lissarensis]MBE1203443.1 ABC transporter substrate-binding protein [Aminobacter carboxidus]